MKVGDYEIEVIANQGDGGWTATALMADGKKVISGPSATEEGAKHDVFVQLQSRLYPSVKVEFTKKFESMDKDQAVVKRRADGLIEVVGRDWVPPHQNVDPETELEMAAKSGFTAWEYADRTGLHHPRLFQAVKGSPYEPLYRRRFRLQQKDPFYEAVKSEADKLLEAPASMAESNFHSPEEKRALGRMKRRGAPRKKMAFYPSDGGSAAGGGGGITSV
jgi:hypothetical protein